MRTDLGFTLGDLERLCPAIYSDKPAESVSNKFVHIRTADVVEALYDAGFKASRAQQKKTRSAERMATTRHLLCFRRQSGFNQLVAGEYIPEVVLVSAHDGTTAYNLFGGMFRVVCANGLIVGSSIYGISVPHIGEVAKNVVQASLQIAESMGEMESVVERMRTHALAYERAMGFAEHAMDIRYKEERPFKAELLLERRRAGDAHDDLWTTYNVVQENLMKGGQEGRSATGRRSIARGIGRVTKDVIYNQKLWDLALEYLND